MTNERQRRGFWFWWTAVGLLAAVSWLASTAWDSYVSYARNSLFVENRSGKTIDWFQVTVGGKTVEFLDVKDGEIRTAEFRIIGDDSFAFRGRLDDGAEIKGDDGYVTKGMKEQRVHFVVLPSGKIDFEQ